MVLGLLPSLATTVLAEDYTMANIWACVVNDDGTVEYKNKDAIDYARSTLTDTGNSYGDPPYKDAPLNNPAFGNPPEIGPSDNSDYTASVRIYLKSGYSFADDTNIYLSEDRGAFAKIDRAGELQDDGSRIYTFTVADFPGSIYDICIPVKQAGTKKCTLTLYPKVGSTNTISVEVDQGATLPDLAAKLLAFDQDYFSAADVEAWYKQAPTKNSDDNTYQFDGQTLGKDEKITQDMSLYAKPKVKEGAQLTARMNLEMYAPLTDSNRYPSQKLSGLLYTPAGYAKIYDAAETATQYWKLPVGSALAADKLPSTGNYKAIIKNASQYSIPEKGATVTRWVYRDIDNSEMLHELKAGEQISAEYALKLLLKGSALIDVYMDGELHNTITFDFTDANLTKKEYELKTTIVNGRASSGKFTNEQLKTITDAVTSKEDTEGFRKLFRGWYLTKKHTGKEVDPAEEYFYGEATLYARWENAYTLKYDFGPYTPTNDGAAQLYADTRVALGDKLKEPKTPTAGAVAFRGWYTTPDFKKGTQWSFATDTVSGDVTLYAKFDDAKQIPVTFTRAQADNRNEKAQYAERPNTPVVADYPFGPLPELPGAKEVRDPETGWPVTIYVDEGKTRTLTYTGWTFVDQENKTQTLTEKTILANYLADDADSLEVTAAYNVSFTISFDLDGGTPKNKSDVAAIEINAESGCAKKPADDPEKDGYVFVKWINKATGAEFNFNNACTENTVIQAEWKEEEPHTVKFKLIPAEAEMRLWKTDASDTIIDPQTPKDKDGNVVYALKGGEYTYAASAKGYKTVSGTKTVTRDWSDEDAATINEITLTPFQAVTDIELNIPDNKIMQKKSYDLGSLATVKPETAPNKTIIWTVKTANAGVTLGGDGTLTVSDTAVVGSTVTLTATIAEGALSSDGTEKADYKKDFTLTITKYLATISFEHGTGDHPNVELPKPQSVKDDSTLDAPTLSASGWTFDGWYKEAACTTKWKAEDTFEADTTLYAKWTKNPVDVTITFAGGEGATLNSGASSTHNGKSGDEITLPPCMYTKSGYIFRSWGGTFAGTEYTLPEEAVTFTASWTQVSAAISEDDITHALDGLTKENAKNYKPQLLAVRDALAAGTATKTNAALIAKLSELFADAGLGPVEIAGDAKNGVSEVGAILSSDGAKVVLTVNKLATPIKTLPDAYKNAEYKAVWYSLSMTVGGATTTPKVPVILTMPIPADLSEMAADTIRVLLYKGAETQPVVMTPTVKGSNLTFAYDGNGDIAIVGKAISDAKDTRVTALEMRYNGTKMGNVEQDANGNFTVTLPSTTSESVLQDLASGINSKWITYMTVAPQAKVKPAEGGEQTAEYWAKTGVTLTYSLTSDNKYSATQNFTVTAGDGTTTRTFTVTVKKITDADRTYKIAVANISGGTVTATPSPAAAGEEVKLTVTPNDGKKLIAGSLSYCLQSAGAKSVPIDENTRTFIMPAGDININAQFEDDASAPIKNPPQITAFMINGVSAVINSDTKAITIILPYGTDLRHVAPTIVTANASKVEPSSAQRVDLSTPKAYRVYASNGAYVTYTVTAYTEEPSPTQSLWEKLQNQINSNPNWWELAEYQKKTGYYK